MKAILRDPTRYWKFFAALATAVIASVTVGLEDGAMSTNDWITVVMVFAGAITVERVKNGSAPKGESSGGTQLGTPSTRV